MTKDKVRTLQQECNFQQTEMLKAWKRYSFLESKRPREDPQIVKEAFEIFSASRQAFDIVERAKTEVHPSKRPETLEKMLNTKGLHVK